MMGKRFIFIFVFIFIVAFLIGYLLSKFNLTGEVVSEEEYSYTKAICNSENGKCIDVLVECINGQVKSLKPMSDFLVIDLSTNVNNSQLC